MEVLGICYIDGVPLEVCKFLVDNISDPDSSEVSNEEQFQRHMVDRWFEIFVQQERREADGSTVLYATRDCRVQSSTVGSLWRRCAFVLLPKEPLPVGPAANQQRLLAVTVGQERLSPEEVADRVRATYGSTALLQSQKLQRCGEGASRTDGSDPAGEFILGRLTILSVEIANLSCLRLYCTPCIWTALIEAKCPFISRCMCTAYVRT